MQLYIASRIPTVRLLDEALAAYQAEEKDLEALDGIEVEPTVPKHSEERRSRLA